jgi:hypothetical protein
LDKELLKSLGDLLDEKLLNDIAKLSVEYIIIPLKVSSC